MLGTLSEIEIEAVLKEQLVGHLGCHANDMTFVVPMSYAYDGMYVYGHSAEGLKIDLMRRNPEVCFEVENMKDQANWKCVIAWGAFEELHDPPEKLAALKVLLDRILPLESSETTHLYPEWPFPSNNICDIKGVVFRIRLSRKTGRFENDNISPSMAG